MSSRRDKWVSPGALVRQTLLFTGAVVVLPLVFYPRRLGLLAFDLHPAVALLEWAFYLGAFMMMGLRLTFPSQVVAAGFTVVYRLVCGMVLGSIIALVRAQAWGATTAETCWSYPLALILQVLLAPAILRPVWERTLAERRVGNARRPVVSAGSGLSARPAGRVAAGGGRPASAARVSSSPLSPHLTHKPPEPSLESALAYVGEYDGVRMCWIVDDEGLPLAVWQRRQYTGDADFWSPVALDMINYHRCRLSSSEPCHPERLEVRTDQGRVIVEAVGEVWLGVLTDPDADELINVRLSRAREMIARNLHDIGSRYAVAGEVHYV